MDAPDHRRLGRQLKIFATDDACGAGLPLWLPAGAIVRSEIERLIVDLGHVFSAGEHVEEEIASILELVDLAYKALAIPAPTLRLSRKGDGPKYAADTSVWARSEELVRSTLVSLGLEYVEAEGEAALLP